MTLPDREPDLTPVDPGRPEILRRIYEIERGIGEGSSPDAASAVHRVIGVVFSVAEDVLEPVARELLETLWSRARAQVRAEVRRRALDEIATRTGVDR